LVDSLAASAPLHVQRDEISVAEKIAWILDRLEAVPEIEFDLLISELRTRSERIAAFLAILELIRLRLIAAVQRRPAGEIQIRKAGLIAGDGEEDPVAV
ncbi:MAG TPA: segregation/condensation protein A, partial [Candidatus Polarisedimenticolia bacterium]|nr:segregation/condensation protein A [Candidatus Polarisedimenticolia bacterium]